MAGRRFGGGTDTGKPAAGGSNCLGLMSGRVMPSRPENAAGSRIGDAEQQKQQLRVELRRGLVGSKQ